MIWIAVYIVIGVVLASVGLNIDPHQTAEGVLKDVFLWPLLFLYLIVLLVAAGLDTVFGGGG